MSQTGLTLDLIYRCRCHVPDRSYTDTCQADAVSQIGFTLACISRGRCMSQTCLTLALILMLMPCPRHGLTLALIMWLMHVPDLSYTSTHP
ncbi:hypothetical protein F383_18491 [Gossypium arboreum]|uniref:Uncharacterized protein n=1 Tax=Gossypium arboreum TaxID=29729 RepID=A0A0B0NJ92_GOSAR|nr:hypothetical protein F383_18491 [Gossypium arboreum]